MYNHNKAQQSKNRVHISWDILYQSPMFSWVARNLIKLQEISREVQKCPDLFVSASATSLLWNIEWVGNL